MLDHMLEVMYKQAQQTSIRNQMADGLKHLPVAELRKIASGEVKLADYDGGEGSWLCKFKGTPLYDHALELETQCLELDAKQQQMSLAENAERRERNNERDAIWDAKDAIRLKKRLLELELRKAELAAETGMAQESVEEEFEESPEEEAAESIPEDEAAEKDAAAYFVNKMRHEVMTKFASRMGIGLASSPYAGKQPELALVERLLGKKVQPKKQKDAEKKASMRFSAAAYRMRKEAGLGQVASTAWQGLKGAGTAIKGLAQRGTTAYQGGGMQGLGKALQRGGSQMIQQGAQFAAQNPGAAAMIGGGALGATALGAGAAGAGAGRATA